MALLTAQDLISAGLQRADMVDSPTGFIKHPSTGGGQAFNLLNAAISELFDTLYEDATDAYGSSATPTPFSTVANQSVYALATLLGTSFYRVRGTDYFNQIRWMPLARINFGERDRYFLPSQPQGYSIEGDSLVIYPVPAAIYSMQVYWVSAPPLLVNDTDTVDLHGPWREFIEKHFAMQCKDIQGLDTSKFERDVSALAQRIRSAGKKRDAGKAAAPVDVQGDWDPWNPMGVGSWWGR